MKPQTVKTKLPKCVRRITILQAKPSQPLSEGTAQLVVRPKGKRKKQSKGIVRLWERLVRRGAKAGGKAVETYQTRHKRSSEKRRDGWLRDYSYNLLRAGRQGGKAFKLAKLLG